MAILHLSLPETLRAFVEAQAVDRGFESDDYVRELIQREHDLERFRRLIREGSESPVEGEMDQAYFDGLRARIAAHRG